MSGIVFDMKKYILNAALLLMLFAGRLYPQQAKLDSNLIAYYAGVQVISADTSVGRKEMAKRYRLLCKVTHTTREQAREYLKQLKNNPAEWQKFQSSVLELLQKKG